MYINKYYIYSIDQISVKSHVTLVQLYGNTEYTEFHVITHRLQRYHPQCYHTVGVSPPNRRTTTNYELVSLIPLFSHSVTTGRLHLSISLLYVLYAVYFI